MSLYLNNQFSIDKNDININYNDSFHKYQSPKNLFGVPKATNNNKRENTYGESSLNQIIDSSIYEELKNQNETKEKLNELRAKYLPNSIRKYNNSLNSSHSSNFNNINYSTFTGYNNIQNRPNLTNEKIDYYQTQKENSKIFQSDLMDSKEFTNFNE